MSRQQLYTMLTRGRLANHVYLPVVGDGDPHSVVRPEVVHPRTATERLEAVLARDGSPTSATTLQRDQGHPAVLLGRVTARYLDALGLAAEEITGADVVAAVEDAADDLVPGIDEAPAWPVLRAHLLFLAASGTDPVAALRAAAGRGTLADAEDPAAVLDWRLDDTGLRNAGPGPLPWLPAVPARVLYNDAWGDYLATCAASVVDLAELVRSDFEGWRDWLPAGAAGPPPGLPPDAPPDAVADLRVWRAAVQVDPGDRRLTGPPQLQKAARTWQQNLQRRIEGDPSPAWQEWGHLVARLAPCTTDDQFRTDLADQLAGLSRAGVDARALLVDAAARGPLPDDHAAAALWWRITRNTPPTPDAGAGTGVERARPPAWTDTVSDVLGAEHAQTVQDSPWWPAIGHAVERGTQRGWPVDALLASAARAPGAGGPLAAGATRAARSDDSITDPGFELLWRATLLTDPDPSEEIRHVTDDSPHADAWNASSSRAGAVPATAERRTPVDSTAPPSPSPWQSGILGPPRARTVPMDVPVRVASAPDTAPRR